MMGHDCEWSLFIYSQGALPEPRQDMEDALDDLLDGVAEVSGGGQGDTGWNIDLELYEPQNLECAVETMCNYLRAKQVSADTHIQVVCSDRRPVYVSQQ